MQPKWKFRDIAQQPNNPRPFYERPWPADLPESCQICGTKFRYGFNLSHGAGKIGRILRTIAYFGFLPCIGIGFFSPGLFPGLYEGLWGSQWFWMLFGLMFIPPLLLAGLSVIMPSSRHLICKKCGWNKDYKILPTPDLPPAPERD